VSGTAGSRSARLSQGPNGCRHPSRLAYTRRRGEGCSGGDRLRILIIFGEEQSPPPSLRIAGTVGGRVKSQIDQIGNELHRG